MSDKHKFAPPSTIPVKNWQKTSSIEEKSDIISRLEKDERIADIGCNVTFAHCSICTICDKAERITGSAKPGTKVFV